MKLLTRFAHHIYAKLKGYFWRPCPLCGKMFSGHEWRPGNTLMLSWFEGRAVCPDCGDSARKQNIEHFHVSEVLIKDPGSSLAAALSWCAENNATIRFEDEHIYPGGPSTGYKLISVSLKLEGIEYNLTRRGHALTNVVGQLARHLTRLTVGAEHVPTTDNVQPSLKLDQLKAKFINNYIRRRLEKLTQEENTSSFSDPDGYIDRVFLGEDDEQI